MTSFAERHIGIGEAAQQRMLETLGIGSVEELMAAAMPSGIRTDEVGTRLPQAGTEASVLARLRELAAGNQVRTSMIGQGYYGTHTPAVLRRTIFENPAWYTAYTPYQPEISQGRLEALLLFQTMVSDLVGLPVTGASVLDEATAAAEAMLLCHRAARGRHGRFVVADGVFAQTHDVLATRAEPLGIELERAGLLGVDLPDQADLPDLTGVAGVLVQYPAADGSIPEPGEVRRLAQAVHEAGGLLVVAADLLALTLLVPPGELGADVVVGTTQRFGVPMGFGGPHAGYLSVREGLQRQLPGRLVGVSQDASGAPALRLALQTREQHIRREKATSNICTAQVLLAVMAAMYAVYHGSEGLRAIALDIHERTVGLAAALHDRGVATAPGPVFDTLQLSLPGHAGRLREAAYTRDVLVWAQDADHVRISLDETTSATDVERLLEAVDETLAAAPAVVSPGKGHDVRIPETHLRHTGYLTHPTFGAYRTETAMMRYVRRLAQKDYALDRGMIPLGSCTMKLNSAVEMAAVSWPEFADIHPFAPAADVRGYLRLIAELETWLADLTGYEAVSVQPNAGSQGELAGLLAIRGYHRSRGQGERTVCLVPSSAHGTNAASAVLAGMSVVVVPCDDSGDIDVEALRGLAAEHADRLAAIMITYPSTHGVYERDVAEVCRIVHDAGGQVYIDGANLNALVGWARPADVGGDVSHLNLHKTFCIPHGGGGPGVGPVAVRSHLAPFLPGHRLDQRGRRSDGAVSAAAFGSPSILPISWAYIALMGAQGLREATAAAVLAANYIAARLDAHVPVLYRGSNGFVAHECILDLRPARAATGVTVTDVAKRLIDYGFHAPTMSFPVAGTLMVEPTESEDLAELDRFCEAMIGIAEEIARIADGTWPVADSPLRGAPHTAAAIAGEWTHPYTRAEAVFPVAGLEQDKYWPPVRRVDDAYGDRHLVCSCPSPQELSGSEDR